VGARKSQRPRGNLIPPQNVFCCDSASLIDLRDAGLLRKMRGLVQSGRLKIPEGVYKELKQKTDKLAKTIEQWEKKYSFVVSLDYRALELLPNIEKEYGPQFNLGGNNYPGFWASSSGRKSVDAQVLALAKSRGWIVVSNDNSIHGACMFEDIECRRWEEIGRLLLGPEQPHLPGL
jgi:uncharacterized protein YacL